MLYAGSDHIVGLKNRRGFTSNLDWQKGDPMSALVERVRSLIRENRRETSFFKKDGEREPVCECGEPMSHHAPWDDGCNRPKEAVEKPCREPSTPNVEPPDMGWSDAHGTIAAAFPEADIEVIDDAGDRWFNIHGRLIEITIALFDAFPARATAWGASVDGIYDIVELEDFETLDEAIEAARSVVVEELTKFQGAT